MARRSLPLLALCVLAGTAALALASCFRVPADASIVFTCREPPPECPPDSVCTDGVCVPITGSDAGAGGDAGDAAPGGDAGDAAAGAAASTGAR
jgi:hypothetical protein